MVVRTWACIGVCLIWSLVGLACGGSEEGAEHQTVIQALAPTDISAIQLCGALKGGDCAEGTYCRYHDGVCGELSIGWCAPVTEFCTMDYNPVCGCDGQTYSNECVMMGAAVSMAHEGECEPGCSSDAECGVGQICDHLGCGDDAPGQCVKLPMVCNRLWDPVCGCDGDTFSNDCHRLHAGVALAHTGPCAAPCGGIAGLECEGKEVCYYPEGSCDIVDNMGVCELPPKKCPKTTNPVCGCDGLSYRNACMLKRAGVSMAHPGTCCTPILCLVGEAVDTDGDGCGDFCPPAQGCEEPNPVGCKNVGCDEGETCTFGVECTPSICFCDNQTGAWACTKDCGGGICLPDEPDLCADFEAPGCVQSGCDDGFVCDQSVGCVPSACGCDPETGDVICTADCGGGTCVPDDEPVDLCADYVAPGCVQSGCDDGFVCDQSVGCVPSICNCDPETGFAMCTMDCGGGTCVPEDPESACETPNPEACTVGSCAEGFSCDLTIGASPSNCNCTTFADGEAHWNCTKDSKPGLCVPDDLGTGCCVADEHCDVSETCVNGGSGNVGVCKPLPPPAFPAVTCWADSGCPDGQQCDGGIVCPCNAQCIVPDAWGTCVSEDAGGPGVPDVPQEEQ